MRQEDPIVRRIAIMLAVFVAGCGCGFAFNPALAVSAEPRPAKIAIAQPSNTRFAHRTTKAASAETAKGELTRPPATFRISTPRAAMLR